MATASVQLNPREQQLRRLLLDVASSIDETGNAGEPIVLRWAGGWVRDKLLNIESNDIDVAINAMTGVSFAQHMCDYCEKPDAIAKHGIGPDDIGSLHNVARNPDKSKHLETAMVKMFGLDLDFVNLRKETYTEDSRNPQMEFGTAQEDALRRDATVNALFYNLHTDRVEDLTGGLQDMAAKIIRTPLEPFQTFMDDPLRVLRLVRFASRLQFTIDASTRQFMADPSVLEALRIKISRERVGVELEKMLKGAHPCESLQLIDELGLYSAVFTDPARKSMATPDISKWPIAYKCLDKLIQHPAPGSVGHLLIKDTDEAYYAWNLAAVCPWMNVHDPPNPKRKANAPPPVAVAAREGFKAPNKLIDTITASYRNRNEILSLKKAVCNQATFINERDRFGMAIRKWDTQVGSWRLQVLNAILVESMDNLDQWSPNDTKEQTEFVAEWQKFLDHLVKLDVWEAPSLKRLLDGRQLAKALGVKPGIWTGKALEICVAWQLRNPEETDPAGLLEHRTLDDVASEICGSRRKAGLYDAVLTAVAYLSRPEHNAWNDDQISNLTGVINENVLLPSTNPDDEIAPLVAEAGIACLSLISSTQPYNIDDSTLLTVVAFTDSRDPWTTKKASSLALDLLSAQLSDKKLADFVIGPILQTFLKPLFAKSSLRTTASGRPAHYQTVPDKSPQPGKISSWKDHAPWAVSTLRWAINLSESSLIQDHWPLFTPALLALVEDERIEVKSSGLEILALFVGKCPTQVLHTTGIGLIFEDVTFPVLLYLPSLTPEEDSIKLLAPAYDVLITLAKTYQPTLNTHRRKILDRALREGIFAAYFHASEHARLVQLLMESAALIIKCMGICSIKHLKSLLSMISSLMEDPFATEYPPAILAAAKTLNATIMSCWPRLQEGEHMEQIIRTLSLCWLNLCEDDSVPRSGSEDFNAISQELVQASNMMQLVWNQNSANPIGGLSEVLQKEPRLAQLFPTVLNQAETSAP
ncbi:hypothetical protein AK830_g6462 [Neonectria ditissima]|uniref:CCA tRNA nucleotidyltransferase, mitochondrial n=1 Tax=Neonectria ditissima TaxID=78410 RepID=A0A0P7BIF6_9HYPO|nr:hypothetical protein AK830_g6462 [Neonectria ditissima]